MKKAWVYFITNKKKSVLYTGMTSDMSGRLQKHVDEHYKGFPSKYGLPAGRQAVNTSSIMKNSPASLMR